MVRAVRYDEFGGVDVLAIGEVDEPKVGPDWVLVDVAAAGLNPVDWKVREGYLQGAFDHHFPIVPAWDLAGTVVKVGPEVQDFAPGDRVFGYARLDAVQRGTLAERVSVPDRVLAKAPESIDLVTAAAVPLVGLTAYQILRRLDPRPGETVLVHAAAGGVGHLAVQLAARAGARVLGTASERNADFLRSLGAERVPHGPEMEAAVRALAPDGVDVVVDLYGEEAIVASDPLLKPGGRVGSVVGAKPALTRGGVYTFVRPSGEDLTALARLLDAGELRVEVEEVFGLDRVQDAFRRLESGHVRGKVVVQIR